MSKIFHKPLMVMFAVLIAASFSLPALTVSHSTALLQSGRVQSLSVKTTSQVANSKDGGKLKLTETGLESGVKWWVSVSALDPNVFSKTYSTTERSICVSLSQGTYNVNFGTDQGHYVLAGGEGASIQIDIGNGTVSIPANFIQQFPVIIRERGVPVNTTWGFSLNGAYSFLNYKNVAYGRSSTLAIYAVNGTYEIAAGSYRSDELSGELFGNSGNVTIDGGTIKTAISFYPANISEIGLPENTKWGFPSYSTMTALGVPEYHGPLYPGDKSFVTLYLSNGSTMFRPVASGFYSPGTHINVTGSGVNGTVFFQKEYPVTFHAHGSIPVFLGWVVQGIPYTYNGTPSVFTNSTQTYMLPNGTYKLSLSLVGTYRTTINGTVYIVKQNYSLNKHTLRVSGKSLDVNVNFTAKLINTNSVPYRLYNFFYHYWSSVLVFGTFALLIAVPAAIMARRKNK